MVFSLPAFLLIMSCLSLSATTSSNATDEMLEILSHVALLSRTFRNWKISWHAFGHFWHEAVSWLRWDEKKYQITGSSEDEFLQMKFVHFLLKYALPLVAHVLTKKSQFIDRIVPLNAHKCCSLIYISCEQTKASLIPIKMSSNWPWHTQK